MTQRTNRLRTAARQLHMIRHPTARSYAAAVKFSARMGAEQRAARLNRTPGGCTDEG